MTKRRPAISLGDFIVSNDARDDDRRVMVEVLIWDEEAQEWRIGYRAGRRIAMFSQKLLFEPGQPNGGRGWTRVP